MSLNCSINRNTTNEIPLYRKQFIEVRIIRFLNDFKIQKWPVDCVSLIKSIRDGNKILLQIGVVSNVSDEFDAVSCYVEEENVYQIIINRSKIHYPFSNSKDRRLNFTIAHELGHIFLDHLCIPDFFKTDEEKHIEDLEANEFAGRLLIPESNLLECNFVSIPLVAKHFNVSHTALYRRLENLKRLDLLNSKKSRVCGICGNFQHNRYASYCRICGNTLRNNLNGVERISYYEVVDFNRDVGDPECPYCGKPSYIWIDGACPKCNFVVHNFCHSSWYTSKGTCSYDNPQNARFCEMCGSKTYFYSMGFLKGWEKIKSARY